MTYIRSPNRGASWVEEKRKGSGVPLARQFVSTYVTSNCRPSGTPDIARLTFLLKLVVPMALHFHEIFFQQRPSLSPLYYTIVV
jgi:hypothetical protein